MTSRVAWNDTATQAARPGAGLYLVGMAVATAGN